MSKLPKRVILKPTATTPEYRVQHSGSGGLEYCREFLTLEDVERSRIYRVDYIHDSSSMHILINYI